MRHFSSSKRRLAVGVDGVVQRGIASDCRLVGGKVVAAACKFVCVRRVCPRTLLLLQCCTEHCVTHSGAAPPDKISGSDKAQTTAAVLCRVCSRWHRYFYSIIFANC